MSLTEQDHIEEAWTAGDVRQSIRRQAIIAERATGVLSDRVDSLLEKVDSAAFNRVYLTGCGDSLYAAMAAKAAFERWTKLPTEVLPSMEFSRYSAMNADEHSLVVCLSNSGRVSRTIEAARIAQRQGATALAITGRTNSALAESSELVLSQYIETPELPTGGGSLGLANYLVSLLALYEVARQVGEARSAISGADSADVSALLAAAPEAIELTYDACESAAAGIAQDLVSEPVLYVLGAGPSMAAAFFGCAKLYEQPQFEGVPQELEEWAHLQYFMVTEGTPVLFVAPPGQSRDRSLELFEAAQLRGGRVTAVGGVADGGLAAAADAWMPLCGTFSEETSPLVSVVPLELLADSLASSPNRLPRRPRRDVDPSIEEDFEFRRIYGSQVAL